MTEAEWLAATDPQPLLGFMVPISSLWKRPRKVSDRKVRLFACACCRRIWHLLSDGGDRKAIEVTERYADNQVKDRDRETAYRMIAGVHTTIGMSRTQREAREAVLSTSIRTAGRDAWHRVPGHVVAALLHHEQETGQASGHHEEIARQAGLLREIFGNPFRPVAFSPSWRTTTVLALARQAYESRDFSVMPILADALQDAGCENAAILDHLRDPNATHVRGCWALDALLGNE